MKSAVRLNPASLFFMTVVCFAFLALVPKDYAVVPPPDGGYPNFTTAEGQNALKSLTIGAGNTAIGSYSLFTVATANFNTAVGVGTLALNTADENTATGAAALLSNSMGFQNTANGAFALLFNTIGSFNTAIGDSALYSNLDGLANTAVGASALQSNTGGGFNTAVGNGALLHNAMGSSNTAIGIGALSANTMGEDNTAHGYQALFSNVDGDLNTAIGWQALQNNTNGIVNIALGADAGSSLTTGSYNIDIGHSGVDGESGTIRIGNDTHHFQAFIAGIRGVTVPGGIAVMIDANGHLGTNVSSARFKEEIKPMDKASEAILALKPVTFCYKRELDPNGIQQFGLVAEDVETVNPDLVARDKAGKPCSVRYDQINAMLLNEFLKEHRTVKDQGATIKDLKREIENLILVVKEQTAQIQKLSTQVQSDCVASQVVLNNP